jgi:transcription-repair coupling factor (superfamily II helicase)
LFDGLEIVTTNTIENEYLKIKYDKNENLYVPLRNVNKLSGYHKNDLNQNIKLDSLSSTKWKTKKRKAFERSIDHAAEILDIESRRNKSNSFVLKVDDRNLNIFKDDFPYTETIDQTNSFNQIRHDLSLLKPMNRVLCGDVGFGKTEVAMQASYISVFSGKQVIIITPSTILCEQHFITFKDRFAKHPVIINKINRNEGKKLNDKTITEFNNKKVDILITTHIIFNNNINFENTGLLIIDEEHKFGIKQKNYIKDKQSNIHILYLSATPIPRTMSMVFAGLKDFSFINSPPSNRVSVKSFLKVQTKQLIKEALIRERNRNGQCFIVQNNINKMETLKREINELLPDFKISIGHGKLNKKDISKVMLDFRNGNVDGLICTTIVEMGLDISNANTMIIIDSHNFGLAQLHQLRGRVGRSEKQGYCYFMIPTMEIPKIAKNRLDSVVRYSNLGEGYFIAQEDLEIRGGGEMLGEKQSGHVDSVGLSLYLSMLKESLNIVTNKKESEIEVNFNDSSYINESYLPSPVERLKIYRKINKSSNLEELNKVKNSLNDRCGKMPQETKNLLDNKTIILKINGSGIESIKSSEKKTTISLSKRINNKLFKKIIDLTNNDQNCSISKDNKLIYTHNKFELIDRRKIVHNLLNEIL